VRFDVVLVVDWSAASTPKLGPDSIWIAEWPSGTLTNIATRHAAEHVLAALIDTYSDRRVVVGCDFSFGFPHGTAVAAGFDVGGTPPWLAMWSYLATHIVDGPDNRNNRFEVATELNRRFGAPRFWGAPPLAASEWLPVRKPPIAQPFRAVELRYRAQGLYPASGWQLLGVGSVGSQSLVGIPMLHRLRERFAHRCTVWPFEQSVGAADDVVLAEVWPGALRADLVDAVEHSIKDARQVTAVAEFLGTRPWPVCGLDSGAAVHEEGWMSL
jgi:hypothetical protein